jgi:hypothetical protein
MTAGTILALAAQLEAWLGIINPVLSAGQSLLDIIKGVGNGTITDEQLTTIVGERQESLAELKAALEAAKPATNS